MLVYFDNSATSRHKPEEVLEAYMSYVTDIGTSPGRGSYALGIQASRRLYQSRKSVNSFFHGKEADRVAFTKNSTEAINLFVNGYLQQDDDVIISCYEHNAVLRPIHSLANQGKITYSIVDHDTLYNDDVSAIDKYITPHTKLAVMTLASNLTGQIVYRSDMANYLHSRGIKVLVDASQGGGKHILDMQRDEIDFLAFTAHKDLLGLPGVGGLCYLEPLAIPPLIQGGTGIHGESYTNPEAFPDSYEAGTLNMPAIWGLHAAIGYLTTNERQIKATDLHVFNRLNEGMRKISKIHIYNDELPRISTLCFNIEGMTAADAVLLLDKNQICARGGIHCAILAHKTIGTEYTGAVRFSTNHFNSEEEVDYVLNVLDSI